MRCRSARFVPHLLTPEQKAFRKRICDGNLADMMVDPEAFLGKIVTTDETWIATFEPETKRQSAAWVLPDEGPPPKGALAKGTAQDHDDSFF